MPQTPYEIARTKRPGMFDEELRAHLRWGCVLSTPQAFLMGRPIVKDAEHILQADPWHRFPPEEVDCWLVWLAAGDLSAIWKLVPYPLPWLAWARREGELRFYPFDSVQAGLAKRCKGR